MSRATPVQSVENIHKRVSKEKKKIKLNPATLTMVRGFMLPIIILIVWQAIGTFLEISKTVLPTPVDMLLPFKR